MDRGVCLIMIGAFGKLNKVFSDKFDNIFFGIKHFYNHMSLITLCGTVVPVDTLEPGMWVEFVWLSS